MRQNFIERHHLEHLHRNIMTITILLIGAVFLCTLLVQIQFKSSEVKQKENSELALNQIESTIEENDKTIEQITLEYNTLSQTTIETMSSYIVNMNVLSDLASADESSQAAVIHQKCSDFAKVRDELNTGEIYLFSESGDVFICSNESYLGKNLKEISEDFLKTVTVYEGSGKSNGTRIVDKDGNVSYDPVEIKGYYTYSTLLEEYSGVKYFIASSISETILETELSGINHISNVLKDVTIGKDGFLFAINKETGEFAYFENGDLNLTGKSCTELGMTEAAYANNYSGYQKISGSEYYCVTRETSSDTYGKYLIVAAAISSGNLMQKNIVSVICSCVAFILASCVIAGYGMILNRDVANRIVSLDRKYTEEFQTEIEFGKKKFTTEEVAERVQIHIKQDIDGGKDKILKRKLLGFRNKRGVQRFYSNYIGSKLVPITAICLILIFLIPFFSQTLLSLQDATSMSSAKLSEIKTGMESNDKNSEVIEDYIGSQYLSKTKLLSYMIQYAPEQIFSYDSEDSNTHQLYYYDEDNVKHYVTDEVGNPIYSKANSEALEYLASTNGIKDIYIFDDTGNVILTSSDSWYFTMSTNENGQSYSFRQILDGKTDTYIQQLMVDDEGNKEQFVGNVQYYYTYIDSTTSKRCFASVEDYNKQLAGTWTNGTITKHRGVLQISIDQEQLEYLYAITTIEYYLKDLKVYGDNSYFMAFDKSDNHLVVYSPNSEAIGKSSSDIGMSSSAFVLDGTYSGFQTISGTQYYATTTLVGDYYISTLIASADLYSQRTSVAAWSLLFSFIFIVLASGFYTVSDDKMEREYTSSIKKENNLLGTKDGFIIETPSGKKKKTMSASSRYMKVSWNKKTSDQKLASILVFYLSIASILILAALIYALNNKSSDSIFTYIFSGKWERGWNVFAITEAIMVMILILTAAKVVQILVRSFCSSLGARVETTGDLIASVVKYGGVIGGLFYCLYLFGFNTTSLLTSAGILSIVIGLGAQSLISDIIAGMFIVFEGEFRVGDIVTIGDFRGQVLEIGLRTTKIQDYEDANNIKIFNNSSISEVLNMTKETSYAIVYFSIDYGESLEKVESVFKDNFPLIKKKLPTIVEGPFYKGVQTLNDSSVDLKILATCEEKNRLQLTRDLKRELYLVCQKNNINVPFPQVTLSYRDNEDNSSPTKKEEKASKEFVAEQKEKSQDIDG